jgi:hypothetical protein
MGTAISGDSAKNGIEQQLESFAPSKDKAQPHAS